MKKTLLLIVFVFAVVSTHAQDSMEKIMEGRAREFYRVLGLTDKAQYKKFMQENYTKTFLEKPSKVNRVVSDTNGDVASTKNDKPLDNLDAKAQMYQQLHDDFGGSKLMSLTRKENKIDMVLSAASGLTGTFTFMFDKSKPYLIDGMGVRAEMQN